MTCPLERTEASLPHDRIAAFAIACGALLFIVVLAGPFRGAAASVGRLLNRDGAGPLTSLRLVATDGRDRPLGSLVAMLFFASAPFLVMALAHFGVVLVVGLVALASALSGVASETGWKRLVSFATAPLRTVPLVATAAVASARSASMSVDDIVASQGPFPWHWNVLSDPACLLLLVVVCTTTCAVGRFRPGAAEGLLRGLAGAVAAAFLLGGWSLGPEHDLWGQILFAAKAWGLGLCMIQGGRASLFVTLAASTTLGALALALHIVPIPPWVSASLPWVTGSLALFIVAPFALRNDRRTSRTTASSNPGDPRPGDPAPQRPTAAPVEALRAVPS